MPLPSPINSIASAFDLRSPTFYTHLHKTGKAIHMVLVDQHIDSRWESHLRAPVKYPECELIVDATARKRGRPASSFEEAKRFFSGKHWVYCLKSQVVMNQMGMAIHIPAGIPGSLHDLALFRDTQDQPTKLVMSKPGEPTKILADK
jgi:hypothetical protein